MNSVSLHAPSKTTDLPELDTLEHLIKARRATRHFRPDPLPEGVIDRILDAARWAPSGYNLQPAHFTVVTDSSIKPALHRACMNQAAIEEAPAIIVFTGDRHVAANHFESSLRADRQAASMTDEYERALYKYVPLAFQRGPLQLNWLWKATLIPVIRLATPVPQMPAVHMREWLTRQVMLAAMNFMLAAEAAGLNTCPMEGFDERRVRRVLNIPRSHVVVMISPLGYTATPGQTKSRLPLDRLVHHDRW